MKKTPFELKTQYPLKVQAIRPKGATTQIVCLCPNPLGCCDWTQSRRHGSMGIAGSR